jgi:peptidoglycan/xylan/chitin deacetylase (PgdA/CDA1 family)
MSYNPSIHDIKHLVKAILGRTEYALSGLKMPANELLVLNYHGTQKKYLASFEKQLDLLQKHFEFVSPEYLDHHYSGKADTGKPKVLITFDDGIKNNIHAAKILAKRGIKALFLILPGFVDCPENKQHDYFITNIRPIINTAIDHLPEDTTALSWQELQQILAMGHSLGSHSYTHTLVTGKFSREELENEIIASKKRIIVMAGTAVNSFCGPNNSLLSCGKMEMQLIKQEYRYFLSTFPGSNAENKDPLFVKRSNVEAFWMKGAFIRAIGNWDRKRWQQQRAEFEKILHDATAAGS